MQPFFSFGLTESPVEWAHSRQINLIAYTIMITHKLSTGACCSNLKDILSYITECNTITRIIFSAVVMYCKLFPALQATPITIAVQLYKPFSHKILTLCEPSMSS